MSVSECVCAGKVVYSCFIIQCNAMPLFAPHFHSKFSIGFWQSLFLCSLSLFLFNRYYTVCRITAQKIHFYVNIVKYSLPVNLTQLYSITYMQGKSRWFVDSSTLSKFLRNLKWWHKFFLVLFYVCSNEQRKEKDYIRWITVEIVIHILSSDDKNTWLALDDSLKWIVCVCWWFRFSVWLMMIFEK